MGRRPKIATDQGDGVMRYTRGCNCKRSGCLKNYCECYEAKMLCSINCKCAGCRNKEAVEMETDAMDTKIASALPATASKQLNAASGNTSKGAVKRNNYKREDGPKPNIVAAKQNDVDEQNESTSADQQPPQLITEEGIAATVECLIRVAAGCERVLLPPSAVEQCLFEEMGRCLEEFLNTSINKSSNDD